MKLNEQPLDEYQNSVTSGWRLQCLSVNNHSQQLVETSVCISKDTSEISEVFPKTLEGKTWHEAGESSSSVWRKTSEI